MSEASLPVQRVRSARAPAPAAPAPSAPGRFRPGAATSAHLGAVLLLAVAYFCLARLGIAVAALPGNVTPVWPPPGLAFVALLLGGIRLWPGIFLGEFAVNVTTVPALSAAGMGLGNALEACVAVWLFTRLIPGDAALGRVRDVMAFVAGPALIATTVSATVGVLSLYAGDVVPADRLWHTWRVWWVGDSLGALVCAPLLLAWLTRRGGRPRPAAVAGALAAVFVGIPAAALAGQLFGEAYVVFPVLVFATLRWRLRGATAASAVISAYAIVNTRAGHGTFQGTTTAESLWQLSGFLAMVAVTGLVLAAALTERDALAAEGARLTEALRDNVRELRRTCAELEAFTYSVSRDLRAPVRTIDELAARLCSSSPVDNGGHAAAIRRHASAMATRLDALLAFARLQRQPVRPRPVDLAELVAEALAQLEPLRAGRRIEFAVGPLPTVTGDRALLLQTYVNLIGNAVKFSACREVAHVEIGCAELNGETVFFVRDDGAGFPGAYARRMFGVFQRLHPAGDYEGSGVGLAVVERIVDRHGGRVWAEGEVGAGAAVYFTLGGYRSSKDQAAAGAEKTISSIV